jgi:hypothetical protein
VEQAIFKSIMLEAECMKMYFDYEKKKSGQVERQREKDAWTEQTKKECVESKKRCIERNL